MSSHHSSPDPGATDEPKKRQRIQQACKSCGIKRVKCDGQHPCSTCVRTGDRCDYGLPKKRGPPKGSTRSTSKNSSIRQASGTPSASTSSQPLASQYHRTSSSNLKDVQQHALAPPLSLASDGRHAFEMPQAAAPFASTSSTPLVPHTHAPNTRVESLTARSSMGLPPPPPPPPPQLPRASQFIVDSRHGSYMSLPDITGFTRPKFRGGSSGILDFPSPRPLYGNAGSPDTPQAGLTSPSSFSLSKRAEDTNGVVTANDPHGSRPSVTPFARLHSFTSPRTDGPTSSTHSNGASTPSDHAAKSFINAIQTPKDNQSSEVLPRCIHHPLIPEATEDTIWTLWWQIIAMHWPILLADDLPVVRGQPRVDIHKQPLLYNAVSALACRIWDIEKDGPMQPMELSDGVSARSPTCEELSQIYFVRARYWLLRNDCESTLETAQALLCMSLVESGSGRSSASAEYCMSACRTALELGLHRDFSNRGLSMEAKQKRLRTWWSIYVLDKTNSAMLGRPCVLRFEESDAPMLDMEMTEEYRGWQPSRYDHSPASQLLAGQPVRSLSYFVYASRLAAICENIVLQYNNVRPKAESLRPASEHAEPWDVSVSRLHHQLEEWEKSLPAHLKEQQSGPTFQHVLCQRMWACACRIILHRPYILKQSADPRLPPSHIVCKESAHELCRLVSAYKRDHGTRKLSSTLVYCVFTAATILLADTTSPVAAAAQEAKRCLAECTQHLGNMSGTWTNATVHLNILRHLGKSLDADMAGTGLDAVAMDSPVTATDPLGIPVTGRSGSYRPAGSAFVDGLVPGGVVPDGRQQEPNGHGGISVNFQDARSSLSEERFFEINDETYWGQMPLSSENPQAWEMFTSKYLQTLTSASLAAGSVS